MNFHLHDIPPRPTTEGLVDTGLHCPRCGYNLTGLTQPRCPECGVEFDWDDVRRAAIAKPSIAFERARRWRRVTAFFVTWTTVLFAPWIFARQAVKRIRVGPGLAFGALCFVPVTLRYFHEGINSTYFAWLSAAAIYVFAQALLMTGLDPHGWRRPRATFLFWLAVGGYTTSIVVTEGIWRVPLLGVEELWRFLTGLIVGLRDIHDLISLVDRTDEIISCCQLCLWLAGLGWCYWARLRKRNVNWIIRTLSLILILFLLLNLFAVCVTIGYRLNELYGGKIF